MRSLVLALCVAIALPVAAHDFWIQPSTWGPSVGVTLTAALRVGENFIGDPVPRNAELIESFVVRDADGVRPVQGLDHGDPAGFIRVERPGLMVIGYRSRQQPVELEASKFESYLREEGLESIIALRSGRGQSKNVGKEIFSRCAKAFVVANGARASGFDQPLGLRLELVAETSPFESTTRFRLLFDGKPLTGALVTALSEHGSAPLRARSDAHGRVTFTFPGKGAWLVKSAHMITASPASGADWESLWSSLTFER